MNLRNRSRILKANMKFFLLFLLVLMPISVASSGSEGENGTILVTLDNVVDLPGGGRALEDQVLALGSECGSLDQVLPLALMEKTDMRWLESGIELYLYEITNRTPVHAMVRRIKAKGLQCEGGPNFLLSPSGPSVWGSPLSNSPEHLAPTKAIWNQPAIDTLNRSNSLTGQGVSVVLFDTSCFPDAGNWQLPEPVGSITVQPDYTVPIHATFELLPEMGSNNVNLCSHAEGVASLTKVIAPDTNLELYPVLGDNGFGALSGLLNALSDFANALSSNANAGPTVVNLSLGVDAGANGANMLELILTEVHNEGAVIVAAAGNFEEDQPQFPASLPFVMAVGASDSETVATSYTNKADLYAPGGEGACRTYLEFDFDPRPEHDCIAILNSLSPTGASWAKGTSFATPFVSGLTALLLDAGPTLSPTDIKSLIEDGADQVVNIDDTLNLCSTDYPDHCQ